MLLTEHERDGKADKNTGYSQALVVGRSLDILLRGNGQSGAAIQ